MAKREDGPQVQKGSAPQQSAPQVPWFATREENIRLSALSLAVQSPSANKLKLAREYLNFLMPERDQQ